MLLKEVRYDFRRAARLFAILALFTGCDGQPRPIFRTDQADTPAAIHATPSEAPEVLQVEHANRSSEMERRQPTVHSETSSLDTVLTFDLQPSVGALPIRFGMRRDDVHKLLGAPDHSTPTRDSWNKPNVRVGYDHAGTVKNVGFTPHECTVLLLGEPLWSPASYPDPNPAILRHDANPVKILGFLVFRELGISTSGYASNDPEQLALGISVKSGWDRHMKHAEKPDLTRYQSKK